PETRGGFGLGTRRHTPRSEHKENARLAFRTSRASMRNRHQHDQSARPRTSKRQAILHAQDVLVPDVPGQGAAVANVEAVVGEVAVQGGRTEAETGAELGVDDG